MQQERRVIFKKCTRKHIGYFHKHTVKETDFVTQCNRKDMALLQTLQQIVPTMIMSLLFLLLLCKLPLLLYSMWLLLSLRHMSPSLNLPMTFMLFTKLTQ